MRKKWEVDPEFKCQAITKGGERCNSIRQKDTPYCFWHGHPEAAKKASSKGGVSKAKKPFEVHTNIKDLGELASFLKEAVTRAREALDSIEDTCHTSEKEHAHYKEYIDSIMRIPDPPPEP